MSHSFKTRAAGAGALAALGLTLWIQQSGEEKPTHAAPGRAAVPQPRGHTPIVPVDAGAVLKIPMGAPGRELFVAMDEVCVRGEDGIETFVRLEPPASPPDFAGRMAELATRGEVLPVAYPADEERSEKNRHIVTRQLRMKMEAGDAAAIAGAAGLRLDELPDYAPGWAILSAADPLAAIASLGRLRGLSGVVDADVLLAKKRFTRALPNDPLVTSQWHLKKTSGSVAGTDANVENAWKYGLTGGVKGTGIRIGIVDDGMQTAHPDLLANVDTANGRDWNGNDYDPNPGSTGDEHGTACAGVAAARGNNGVGVSGVAPEATLVGMRLISSSVSDAQEADAMNWKSDIIQVKSNSWGPYDDGESLEAPGSLTLAAFSNATTNGRGGKGTIFVWAGGNGKENADNSNYDGYANLPQTIAVGAIDSTGNSSYYSEPGANIVVCAPSSGAGSALGITTTDRTGSSGYVSGSYYDDFGGTSSATPVVSGVVALMLERNPNLGWRDVQEILIRSAAKFRPSDTDWAVNSAGFNFNHKFGAGLVNATAAVDMAATWQNLPAQSSLTQSNNTQMAIPENSATGVSKSFSFPGGGFRVEHVTLTMTALHTSRGNLNVTLTSPAGMVSQLAEVHADANDNYSNWTFGSVRHWGEFSQGTWTLTVSDRSAAGNTTGGTLGNVTVRLFGASANPPPQVRITSPVNGQSFSPGAGMDVLVEASDISMGGGAGTVTKVELFMDGASVGVDMQAPYSFPISPGNGIHSLVAKATDAEGSEGASTPVSITVANQAPLISSVTLSSVDWGYADEPLMVTAVSAEDPEGLSPTFTYQWQSSTDRVNFTNLSGATAAALPVSASNAGKVWRCMVRASDGISTSAAFAGPLVNLVARPVMLAKPGQVYSYTSGLVLPGVTETVSRRMIFNEFSQGQPGGTNEWLELLVMQSGSIAGWQLREAAGNTITFSSSGVWANVPAGTLIVIYKGTGAKDPRLPVADDLDFSDGVMVIPHSNTSYFSATGWLNLGDTGDFLSVGTSAAAVQIVSYGSDTSGIPYLASVGNGYAAYYSAGGDAAANVAANWATAPSGVAGSSSTPGTGVTPGAANSPANASFIQKLRTNTLSEPSVFRLGGGATLPAGLTLNTSTGVLSGTISASAAPGIHNVAIERYNSAGASVSQSYQLQVFPAGYAQWIAAKASGAATGATADADGDGIPNLVEYMLGSDPAVRDGTPPVVFSSEEGFLTLEYWKSKGPSDANLVPQWATSLDAGAWQTSGITITTLEENAFATHLRASLPFNVGDAKRFLRLRAAVNP